MLSTIRALCAGANFLEISFSRFFTKMYRKVPTSLFCAYFSKNCFPSKLDLDIKQMYLEIIMTSSNKTWALIVGGSSGIGYAIAKQLLQSGIATLIIGNDEEKLEKARQELTQFGPVESLQANLYRPADLARIGAVVNDHSRISIQQHSSIILRMTTKFTWV